MIQIREETPHDVGARERLLDICFGDGRFAKTSQRLREGRLPAEGLSLSAESGGKLVGTVRLWHVAAGDDRPALLLGPLAVDPNLQGGGLGGTLMRAALGKAKALGHDSVLLVGDAPYYARFGFSGDKAEGLYMPGPFVRSRFLGLELQDGALAGANGVLRASGEFEPAPVYAVEPAAEFWRRRVA